MSGLGRRAGLVVAAGLLGAAVPVVGHAALAGRLPARAVLDDTPVVTGSWPVMAGASAFWTVVGCAVTAVFLARRPRLGRRWMVGATFGWVVAVSGQQVALLVSNLGGGAPPWWAQVVVVLATLVAVVVGWRLAGPDAGLPVATVGPGPGAPRMPMHVGERAVWIRSVLCGRRLWQAAGWVLFSVLTWWVTGQVTALFLLQTAVVLAVLLGQVWARVRVDRRGVWVEQPLLRSTLTGVDLTHVQEATAEVLDRRSMVSGFGVLNTDRVWGFRAKRAGELLRLSTADGRSFVVTVPDAATAAALVNTELDRRAAPAC